ncbi:hypothetical protein [Haloechinothrix salitolerans]|uniref:RimK family alpha-L-glutamate ligase n=1 Tax=Haloechinothrix salitolerans TaxID=926830 RepID=A0ABW2C1T8_9PSEU
MAEPKRVLLAGCADLPRGDGDEDVLLPALAEAGCKAEWIVWDDPSAPISDADLVILRATWDYAGRRDEFLQWCEAVPMLRNPASVARWNTDKAYLAELSAARLATVPTEVVPPGRLPEWPAGEFVVKPSVGAGSRGARRFAADDVDGACEHLAELHADGHTALVQPYQADVDAHGETACVFIAGRYSHAFVKGPMLSGAGMDDSGLFVAEKVHAEQPAEDVLAFAEQAMDTATSVLSLRRDDLLYARIDVVRGVDGAPMLLELELTEPSLGLSLAGDAAAIRMAEAVRELLDG